MWPWEHVLVAYLAYSAFARLAYRESPTGLETVAVAGGALLPDLVDKPLAWELGVFESGYALGHSAFVLVPLAIVAGALAKVVGRPRAGVAVGLGALLHPPGDVLYTYVQGGGFVPQIALWPVATVESAIDRPGFLAEFRRLFGRYAGDLLAGDLSGYARVQLALLALVGVVWLADGAPVLRECLAGARRLLVAAVGGRERSDPSKERGK